jgi:glucose/arabinose dehydrogenase
MPRLALAFGLTLTMLVAAGGSPAGAGVTLSIDPVKTGLNGPSGFTFTPDGRILYLERGSGRIVLLDPSDGSEHRFFRIPRVNGDGERGTLGIALHPNWPTRRTVYVYVTRSSRGSLKNQVVRVTKGGGRTRMKVLLSTPASASPYHNGGRILLGPNDKLFVIIGDGHNATNAQDRSKNLRGKILRLDLDGTRAAGNPRGRIWAFGIRTSYGMAFDPQTNRLWDLQNGPGCNDEINRIVKGGNYAWGPNQSCGSQPAPRDTNRDGPRPRRLPEHYFVSPIGISGGAFCQSCGLRAADEGKLFFGCVNDGDIRIATLDADRRTITNVNAVLNTPNNSVHSMEVAPNGTIYFSDHAGIYRIVAN